MQTKLFEEFQEGEFQKKEEKGLKIVSKGKEPLTKNQKLFNSLTKRIENLEIELVNESDKLSKLLTLHGKEISPLENKIANSRIKLAFALDQATTNIKFTKKQTEKIGYTIVDLCDDAFLEIVPTPEQEALYDKWSKVSYKVELGNQEDESKEMFAEFMSEMFGMNIDMDEFDGSPESFAQFQAKLKDQFEQGQFQNKQQNRKKSKKQIAKEEVQKEKDELQNKNIRSIYIALVKILHPDKETDPLLKIEKEEIMKKVTVAYDQKDLATLLKLEMEWVHQTSEHLEKLSDDKLQIYIAALRQQVAELEQEKSNLFHHPRFSKIAYFGRMPEKRAMSQIKSAKSELKQIFESLNDFVSIFAPTTPKKQILEFIDEYDSLRDLDFDLGLDDFLFDNRF